jgi:hypothetical protein
MKPWSPEERAKIEREAVAQAIKHLKRFGDHGHLPYDQDGLTLTTRTHPEVRKI